MLYFKLSVKIFKQALVQFAFEQGVKMLCILYVLLRAKKELKGNL
jgi:hypothetical protein